MLHHYRFHVVHLVMMWKIQTIAQYVFMSTYALMHRFVKNSQSEAKWQHLCYGERQLFWLLR